MTVSDLILFEAIKFGIALGVSLLVLVVALIAVWGRNR